MDSKQTSAGVLLDKQSTERQRGPSNFEVMEVTGVETDISHGVYDTIEEARGCVVFDRLTKYEIWQGDHIVEDSDHQADGAR